MRRMYSKKELEEIVEESLPENDVIQSYCKNVKVEIDEENPSTLIISAEVKNATITNLVFQATDGVVSGKINLNMKMSATSLFDVVDTSGSLLDVITEEQIHNNIFKIQMSMNTDITIVNLLSYTAIPVLNVNWDV